MKCLVAAVGVIAVAVLSPLLAVLTLVIPSAASTSAAPAICFGYTAQIPPILSTIRRVESGDDYTAQSNASSASGAYQFVDATWVALAGAAGADVHAYPDAADAPPELQDQVAATYVGELLDRNDGRVTAIPINWYLGHEPAANSPEWDTIPAGNAITPRGYVDKWMTIYASVILDGDDPNSFCDGVLGGSGTPGDPLHPLVDGAGHRWAVPVASNAFNPSQLDDPHHDYPAWDLMVRVGTPVFAVADGVVTRVTHYANNWWQSGCTSNGVNGCETCGVGITVQTDSALRYTYCHNSTTFVTEGQHLSAGQQVALSGDTGRSGAPHLHVELRINNIQFCPQPIMRALYSGDAGPFTWTTIGCSF